MPNPNQRRPKTCIFCTHFKQLTLEYGVCEDELNLDHYKHFLAPEHGGCGSWVDEANSLTEKVVDKLPEVEDRDI